MIYVEDILQFLSPRIRRALTNLKEDFLNSLTEIRVRKNRPVMLVQNRSYWYVSPTGAPFPLDDPIKRPLVADEEEWMRTLHLVTENSLYALERELKSGFITLPGGFRVGVVGSGVYTDGQMTSQKDISSLNFRVSREIQGIAYDLMPYIISSGSPSNTLILSPPGMGKTTLLRDIARQLSWGVPEMRYTGCTVGVVDERSEIAACVEGVPQHDLGPRLDVLDGCEKTWGIYLVVRSMRPDVLITDEIGQKEDTKALCEASNSGVKIITSAHATNLFQARRKEGLRELLESGAVDTVITLSDSLGLVTVESVYQMGKSTELLGKPFKLEART